MSTASSIPVPENAMLGGLNHKVGPSGETIPVRFTVPVKLLKLVTIIVDVPDEPEVRVNVAGSEEMPKSGPATTVTVVLCVKDPPVPVTFTMYDLGIVKEDTVTFSVEVAIPPDAKLTGFGVKVAVMPVGRVLIVRSTWPKNVSRLVSAMIEFRDESSGIMSKVGSALMLKSGTTTRVTTSPELEEDPLVAVTMTT